MLIAFVDCRQASDPMAPSPRGNNNAVRKTGDNDLVNPVELKSWIESLTWEALLQALEVYEEDSDLLLEMIHLQVPPPTPIHPRAIAHPIASSKQLSDGRYDTEYQRAQQDRMKKPRLLKWVPVTSNTSNHYDELIRPNNSRNKNPKKNTGNKSRVLQRSQYSVMARGFIIRDGNRYAVPPTQDQQQADIGLLHRICLCTVLDNDVRAGASGSRNGLFLRLSDPLHHLWTTSVLATETSTPHENLVELLRITSRGHFLSQAQHPRASLPTWFQPTERWFSLSMYLTARLEMSLVQSYHYCLRERGILQQRGWIYPLTSSAGLQKIRTMISGPQQLSAFMVQVIKESLRRDVSASLPFTRDCLARLLLMENQHLQDTETANFDGVLSSLHLSEGLPSPYIFSLFWSCPLLQVDSAMDQLRSLAREMLQIRLAQQMEQELLQTEEELFLQTASTRNNKKPQNSKTRRSKTVSIAPTIPNRSATTVTSSRRQSKRKPRSRSMNDKQSPSEVISAQQSTKSNQGVSTYLSLLGGEKEEPKSSDEETLLTRHTTTHALDFPANSYISSRTRNRNIVLVLGLLDDVVQDVFGLVGLSSDDGEAWDDVGNSKAPAATSRNNADSTAPRRVYLASSTKQQNWSSKTVVATTSNIAESSVVQLAHAQSEQTIEPTTARNSVSNTSLSRETDQHIDIEPLHSVPVTPFHSSGSAPTTTQGVFDIFASPYGNLAGGFFLRPESIDFAWDTHDFAFDQWSATRQLPAREQSILHDLFLSQERREQEMASSTIASIASSGPDDNATSTGGDDMYIIGNDDLTSDEPEFPDVLEENDDPDIGGNSPDQSKQENTGNAATSGQGAESPLNVEVVSGTNVDGFDEVAEEQVKELAGNSVSNVPDVGDINKSKSEQSCNPSCSPSPPEPTAASPTLSPILVSLADLQVRKQEVDNQTVSSADVRSSSSVPGVTVTSVKSCSKVIPPPKPRMVSSLSRENLRSSASNEEQSEQNSSSSLVLVERGASARNLKLQRNTPLVKFPHLKARDDNDIKNRISTRRRADALESYRTVASRSLAKSRDDHDVIRTMRATPPRLPTYRAVAASKGISPPEGACAQSEIGNDESIQHWPDSRRSSNVGEEADNNTTTRDGSTTITSALSHREADESLREERDTYRDLCLTLGAEVAKLRNLLASQNQSLMMAPHAFDFSSSHQHQMHPLQPLHGPSKYFEHPASWSHLVSTSARSKTLAAMSDAGNRGEYESMTSMASEDDFAAGVGKVSHQRQVSSGATAASDASAEQSVHHRQLNFTVGVPMNQQSNHSTVPLNGVQSRLSVEIVHFVDVISGQLRKQEGKRAKSVERLTRLVTTLWPRAQVKLYGSHITGLSLPTSDVDFVICLPAVQKDAPAVAPGVLEGRNAINETSQKMLARKLKNESWIDPRSMKLIERTVVPVIKVATKDTKAKTLQLDITFDAPSHHGLEAVDLVNNLLKEYPMIRPLVLVLKQFLLDRGLLTGYTGGLSSYCLFLMTARYLQEQAIAWADCGALLMGFLDFYGNHVGRPFAAPAGTAVSLTTVSFPK